MFPPGVVELCLAAANKARKLAKECIEAPEDLQDLGFLCWGINIAIKACTPKKNPFLSRRDDVDDIKAVVESTQASLEELEDMLSKLEDMNGLSGLWNRVTFVYNKSALNRLAQRLETHRQNLRDVRLQDVEMLAQLLFPHLQEERTRGGVGEAEHAWPDRETTKRLLQVEGSQTQVPYSTQPELERAVTLRLQTMVSQSARDSTREGCGGTLRAQSSSGVENERLRPSSTRGVPPQREGQNLVQFAGHTPPSPFPSNTRYLDARYRFGEPASHQAQQTQPELSLHQDDLWVDRLRNMASNRPPPIQPVARYPNGHNNFIVDRPISAPPVPTRVQRITQNYSVDRFGRVVITTVEQEKTFGW